MDEEENVIYKVGAHSIAPTPTKVQHASENEQLEGTANKKSTLHLSREFFKI